MKHSGNGVGLVDAGGSENNAMKQNLARATLAKQVRCVQGRPFGDCLLLSALLHRASSAAGHAVEQ